jgi:hypothetical protein
MKFGLQVLSKLLPILIDADFGLVEPNLSAHTEAPWCGAVPMLTGHSEAIASPKICDVIVVGPGAKRRLGRHRPHRAWALQVLMLEAGRHIRLTGPILRNLAMTTDNIRSTVYPDD